MYKKDASKVVDFLVKKGIVKNRKIGEIVIVGISVLIIIVSVSIIVIKNKQYNTAIYDGKVFPVDTAITIEGSEDIIVPKGTPVEEINKKYPNALQN